MLTPEVASLPAQLQVTVAPVYTISGEEGILPLSENSILAGEFFSFFYRLLCGWAEYGGSKGLI